MRAAGGARPAYATGVDPLLELPDLPQNAVMLGYLRGQANPPSGPNDYVLGSWQLHAHPDLIAVLRDLAAGWPLTAAYGVPVLASEGVAAVVALGTDFLAVRMDDLPAGVEADDDPAAEWSFIGHGWHVVALWQNGERALRELVSAALAHAGDLAAG